MNNFTRSKGDAYWHAITNLTCCSIDLKKRQLFKTFLVLMLFAFSSTSMFAQNRTTFYEVCVADRPEGLTEEQAMSLFPDAECDGTLSIVKSEDLQGDDCSWVSVYSYTLFCNDEEVATQKLMYQGGDLEAPKLEVPADITVECDAIPEPGMPTATDNCDDDVEITYDGEIRVGDNDCMYQLQRTWTATDNCSNSTTLTQTITVQDTKGPELKKGAMVPTGETGLNLCYNKRPDGPSADEIAALFSDNCGDVKVEKEPVFKGTDCMWKGYINYYITDSCGNPGDTITLYYNGGDTESPVFDNPPADITVSCIDQIPANYVLTWTDNCSVSDPKSKNMGIDDTSQLGEACQGGVMTRTWTAQDSCGNEVTHTQTITVEPAPPVAFDELADLEIKCEELAAFEPGTLYYSNGGSGACDISGYAQGVAEDFTDNCGSFTVTYTYNDTCNSLEYVQTVTVIDDVKPELIIPADVTVECDAVPGLGEVSASDNCDTNVDIKYDGEVRTDGDCPDSYTLTRTWTATDNCSNSTTLSQTITVQDTTAPDLTIPADVTVQCDAVPGVGEASATDNCDADVTVTYINEKREDGECADSYLLFRVWQATDNCGNTTLKTQQITVIDTVAPVITGVDADYTVECPDAPIFSNPTASDTCDADVDLQFNDVKNLDDCGLGTITRTWTATDNCLNSSQASQTITIVDTTAPVISGVGDDMKIECPEQPVFSEPTVTEDCDKEYSFGYTDKDDLDECGLGSITRTWTATDCAGNSSSASQTITIEDNVAPEIVGVGDDMTIDCPDQPKFSEPYAQDACDQEPNLDLEDSYNLDDCGLGTVTRTWTATDCKGNSSTASQTITIQDITDPVLTVPADVTVQCDAIPDLGVATATDTCDNDVHVKFVEERTEPGDCENSFTLFRIWVATDCAGNSVLGTQEITVVDTTAPVFAGVGDDMKIECPAQPVFSEPTASDNCAAEVTINFVDKDDRDECGLGNVTRTWTATDNCGNSSEASQTITVEDNVAPEIIGVGDDYTVECPDSPVFSEPTVKDDCDMNPELRFEDSSDLDDCGLGTVTRTWYATDCKGNMSSDSQTITIDDTVAPVISGVNADYTVECPEELVWSMPTVKDDCDQQPKLDFNDDYNLDDCGLGTVTRTWTATDCKGNMSTDSQTITIDDTVAPVISGVGADMKIECPELPVFSMPTATDACDSAPSLTFVDDDKTDDCGLGSITRTWTATDCKGNSSTASQTITIEDNVAPVIDGVGDDFMVECPDEWSFSEPTASDECSDTGFNAEDWIIDEGYDGTVTITPNKLTIIGGNDGSGFYDNSSATTTCPVNGTYSFDWSYSTVDNPEFDFAYFINGIPYLLSDLYGDQQQSGSLSLSCQAGDVIGWGVYSEDSLFGRATLEVTNYNAPGSGVSLTFEDTDTLDACGLGTITRTWTATDCAGNSSTASQTITIIDITAPVISGVGEDMTIDCPAEPVFSEPTVSDECDGTGAETSNQIIDFDASAAWFAFMAWEDPNPDWNGSAGWAVIDAVAIPNVDNNTLTLKPNRVNDTNAYWIDDAANDTFGRKVMTASTYVEDNSLAATAFNYAGNVSAYTLDGAYTVSAFIRVFQDGFQNLLEISKPISTEGDFSITYDGAYEGGAIVQYGFVMVGANVNPGADFDAAYDALGSVEITATVNELTLTYEDDDKRDDCGLGEVTRTWTATDCAGNSSTASQTITVQDITDPYFNEALPQDVTEECDKITPAAILTASDACDSEIDVMFNEQKLDGNCPGNYTLVRTWTAADCAGNDIEHVQTVTVQDTTAPVEGDNFNLPPSISDINACQDEYLAPPMTEEEFAAMFTDNCSNVVVSLFSSPVGNNCGWSIIHIYTVADDCGNLLGDYKVYYSGEDLTAPELVGLPADTTIECTDEIPLAANVTAIDTCDDDVKAEFNENTVNYNCAGNYDILRTWTATDDCGNSVSHTQTIQVRDNEAPYLDGVLPEGSNENNLCAPDTDDELAALGVLTEAEFAALYKDSCSGVNVTRTINLNGDDCKWIMDVLYTITDDCGNEAQPVKVWYHGADMTAPVQSGLCENETMDIYTSQYGVCPADATFVYDDEITANSGQVSIAGVTFDHSNLKPCFTDNCATQEELTFVVTGTDEGNDKTCPRTMTITFDVYDNCGNAYKDFVCTFVIIDDVNPVIDECPADIVAQPDFAAPSDINGFTTLGLYNGKYYYLSNDAMPATAAPAHAALNGGQMATLSDDAENQWAYDAAVASNGGNNVRFWIGLTDTAVEGTFEWLDGTPLAYTNWANGEPNNSGNEDCVELGRYNTAQWNDEPCTNSKRYLLEVDATQGCGAVVTFDEPKASDNCDLVSFEQTAGLASGSEFPIGTTTVTYTATDACGNVSECSFNVTVECETEAPELVGCPDTDPQNPMDLGVSGLNYSTFNLQGVLDLFIPLTTPDLVDNCTATRLADWTRFSLEYVGSSNDYSMDYWYGYFEYTNELADFGLNVDECGNAIEEGCTVWAIFSVDATNILSPKPCGIDGSNDGNSNTTICDNSTPAQAAPNQGEDMAVALDFTAYPVPFDRDVNVKFNFEFDTNVTIEVHDTKGLLVKSLTLNNVRAGSDVTKSFDLSRAGDQLFYITVTTNQGSVTKKVVSSNMKIRR